MDSGEKLLLFAFEAVLFTEHLCRAFDMNLFIFEFSQLFLFHRWNMRLHSAICLQFSPDIPFQMLLQLCRNSFTDSAHTVDPLQRQLLQSLALAVMTRGQLNLNYWNLPFPGPVMPSTQADSRNHLHWFNVMHLDYFSKYAAKTSQLHQHTINCHHLPPV